MAVSADEAHISSALIYRGQNHQEDWFDDVIAIDDALLDNSDKGWMNNKLELQ